MTDATLPSNERVSTADLEACRSWLVARGDSLARSRDMILMVDELLERRSSETSERHVCWACQATYAGPRAGGKCSRCASGADPVRAVAWVGFPADQPKPDYDIAYDEVSKLPGHQYTAVYWQPPAPKANSCVCGEPNSPGTHRTDGPCLAPMGDRR